MLSLGDLNWENLFQSSISNTGESSVGDLYGLNWSTLNDFATYFSYSHNKQKFQFNVSVRNSVRGLVADLIVNYFPIPDEDFLPRLVDSITPGRHCMFQSNLDLESGHLGILFLARYHRGFSYLLYRLLGGVGLIKGWELREFTKKQEQREPGFPAQPFRS